MISLFQDYGQARLKKVEDKMEQATLKRQMLGRYFIDRVDSNRIADVYTLSNPESTGYSNIGEEIIETLSERVSDEDRIKLIDRGEDDASFQVIDCNLLIYSNQYDKANLLLTNCHPEHSTRNREEAKRLLEELLR
jgi:hypothetical protein